MALIAVIQVIITFVGDEILRSKPLFFSEWTVIISFAVTIIPVDMVKKWIFKKSGGKEFI
jgi:hypothetical protein